MPIKLLLLGIRQNLNLCIMKIIQLWMKIFLLAKIINYNLIITLLDYRIYARMDYEITKSVRKRELWVAFFTEEKS